ncbi:hypothetical protein Pcinc_008708 [Petrolisthes cinctipes]|uniref:Cell division control protein n=1 Tax=Petrolisthes cinctipes TaxID=88211 RepID=A0AAE1KX04_PETCI|nr:hypothetical protein Pcinc_008708 [Petrolisthes cinctipes]
MRVQQESIAFPIRKSRSRNKSVKPSVCRESAETEAARKSPRKHRNSRNRTENNIDNNDLDTSPPRKGKNSGNCVEKSWSVDDEAVVQRSPRKSCMSDDIVGNEEIITARRVILSPRKSRQNEDDTTTARRVILSPRKSRQNEDDTTTARRVILSPKKSRQNEDDMTAARRVILSPKKSRQNEDDMTAARRVILSPKKSRQNEDDMTAARRVILSPRKSHKIKVSNEDDFDGNNSCSAMTTTTTTTTTTTLTPSNKISISLYDLEKVLSPNRKLVVSITPMSDEVLQKSLVTSPRKKTTTSTTRARDKTQSAVKSKIMMIDALKTPQKSPMTSTTSKENQINNLGKNSPCKENVIINFGENSPYKENYVNNSLGVNSLFLTSTENLVKRNIIKDLGQTTSPLKSPLKSSSKSPLKLSSKSPLKLSSKSSLKLFALKDDVSGIQKSPLKSSSKANIMHDVLEGIGKSPYCSPSKTAVKRLNLGNTPIKKSPLRTLSVESPRRSPRHNLASPRRSPRKLPQSALHYNLGSPVKKSPRKLPQSTLHNNMESPVKKSPMRSLSLVESSPRRSPRKLTQSKMSTNSPSTLMSKMCVKSPAAAQRKRDAVSLCKPDVSAYRALRQSLNTAVPTVLVCREKEINGMESFLTQHLKEGRPGSLYISGAPGTGKTASLNNIIDKLQMKKLRRVFINCMALKTSAAIYKAISIELGIRTQGTERENRNAIEKAVCSSKQPVLLMLDEVDQLDSKNQEVLYTIFEWPALNQSKLVLVGIANSLDLTDRILPRLQARPNFKPTLMHFPPYSKKEIITIINHRISQAGLDGVEVIRPSAIQLLAGKVAAVAGDVRKALDVCRRAVELCEGQVRKQALLSRNNNSGSPKKILKMVDIPQVLSIFNEVYGSRVVSAVSDSPDSFSLQQKLLICCLLLFLKHARSKDITLGKFHDVYARVCKKRQLAAMDQSEFLSLCTLLESRGMLLLKQAKEIRSSKVILRLNAEEAEHTLGDRSLLASILEDTESLGNLCKKKK